MSASLNGVIVNIFEKTRKAKKIFAIETLDKCEVTVCSTEGHAGSSWFDEKVDQIVE